MEHYIINFVNDFGYLGIVLLIALENVLPPIPSEVILTFAGFMTLSSNLTIWGSVIAATIGAVLGAIILYVIGSYLTTERLSKIVDSRLGKILRLKHSDITKTHGFFVKHGAKTIFFGRFVPVIRSLISLPAGMTKMSWKSFALLTTLGTLIWNLVLILLGRAAGEAWTEVSATIDSYSSFVLIGIIGLIILGGTLYYFKRIKVKS
ncbi:DedA family protein [Pediococcus stilesii]|uniref:DedA family protein n=1 Tax=Pediococcus stilesii TaxID=331679 RepID=A0A5R9BWV0_9LACO|nr:DedA family protein [Pediococcus stilesii]TLQ05184.1 DedA family protein [Pediococcus stilesii]